jgi:hypothetical protein
MKKLILTVLGASMAIAGCTSAKVDDAAGATSSTSTVTTTTTTTTGAGSERPDVVRASARGAAIREVTIPSGTVLHLRLTTAVASDTSAVEDAVSAELTSPIMAAGATVVPAGAVVTGIVSAVDDSGRVKGRARLAVDFTSVTTGGARYRLSAAPYSRLASATKSEDATKIGIGAGAGAVIGGLLGGKKGAAEGAAVGGGAGTGVVLATKGDEVRFASGTDVSTSLTAPLTIRVPR